MKKIIGIGLVSAALLAGCGGGSTGTGSTSGTGTEAGAGTTAVAGTTTENAAGIPTSETGAGEAADTAADSLGANNATAVSDVGATTVEATAEATPEAATNTGDAPGASGATTDNNGTAGSPNTSTTEGGTTGGTTDASGGTTGGTDGAASGAYQSVGIPELGLSFQVPEGWEQVSGENAWSPAGVDTPRVGVESADLTADWRPSSFLPEGATVRSSQQVNVNGTQAMLYTVENSDGTAETHAILRSGEKAYDIYARAESLQELQTVDPVLNDIVGSVELSGV